MSMILTKSYRDRIEAALVRCANQKLTDAQAFAALVKFLRDEQKQCDAITSMPMFRAWFEGERFEVADVSNKKR